MWTAAVITALVFLACCLGLRALLKRAPLLDEQERPAGPVIPTRRAQGPALRIHLCANCIKVQVPRPGDACEACLRLLNPVQRAEQITREAMG